MSSAKRFSRAEEASTQRWSQYFNKVNLIPALPEYSGPYKVGTVDVEIPVSQLHAPSEAPPNAADIQTVQFRVFYPATPESDGKRVSWLPMPQRAHVAAYSRFLGLNSVVSELVSFLPRHLHYSTIPAHKNSKLLEPGDKGRWPTMVFSHGLGGNRNAYSHIAGSLAAHGVVVFCPEHRDGSAACTFIRDPANQDRFFTRSTRRMLPYESIPHTPGPDTWDARNQQLKIRLWELGLIHEAILELDLGKEIDNLNKSTPTDSLRHFASKLAVHEPGSMLFGGHSFGAATITQFLKSVYYAKEAEVQAMTEPLFSPASGSRIRAQITPNNPIVLLDMWCFPLIAPSTSALYHLPLPAYANAENATGGSAFIAVESDSFVNWKEHLHTTARILSPNPSAAAVSSQDFEREGGRFAEPNFFHAHDSAHLSQSDFGVLFPWVTKKVFGAGEPERALRLNVRAILQMLRINGVPVGRTWSGDLVDGVAQDVNDKLETSSVESLPSAEGVEREVLEWQRDGINNDTAILDHTEKGCVDAWSYIDVIGLGAYTKDDQAGKPVEIEGEVEMEGEMEPQVGEPLQAVISAAA